jgi:prefoldin subunit 5
MARPTRVAIKSRKALEMLVDQTAANHDALMAEIKDLKQQIAQLTEMVVGSRQAKPTRRTVKK